MLLPHRLRHDNAFSQLRRPIEDHFLDKGEMEERNSAPQCNGRHQKYRHAVETVALLSEGEHLSTNDPLRDA